MKIGLYLYSKLLIMANKIKVRFNLGRGKNYMKWKIQSKSGVEYHYPADVQLIMKGCQLKNNRKTAEKIFNGENKDVCAWVLCDSIDIKFDNFENAKIVYDKQLKLLDEVIIKTIKYISKNKFLRRKQAKIKNSYHFEWDIKKLTNIKLNKKISNISLGNLIRATCYNNYTGLNLISNSKKPVIIGGHGIWWSSSEKKLEEAGNDLNIPIFNVPYHQKLLGEEAESYMGLADIHQFPPSKFALHESDVVIMVGGRLDNQMNFGNPPLFPKTSKLICVNGSHEEIELNRAADINLLCDPGIFFEHLIKLKNSNNWISKDNWFQNNKIKKKEWIDKTLFDLEKETNQAKLNGEKIHPLQLALDVHEVIGENDWLVIDGGNTHFWSEIAINISGYKGKKLKGIMHPGTFSMLGVGVPFAISAKKFLLLFKIFSIF